MLLPFDCCFLYLLLLLLPMLAVLPLMLLQIDFLIIASIKNSVSVIQEVAKMVNCTTLYCCQLMLHHFFDFAVTAKTSCPVNTTAFTADWLLFHKSKNSYLCLTVSACHNHYHHHHHQLVIVNNCCTISKDAATAVTANWLIAALSKKSFLCCFCIFILLFWACYHCSLCYWGCCCHCSCCAMATSFHLSAVSTATTCWTATAANSCCHCTMALLPQLSLCAVSCFLPFTTHTSWTVLHCSVATDTSELLLFCFS